MWHKLVSKHGFSEFLFFVLYRPEDYRPFPDDGMGWGDYPMLKEESPDMKSDWENYDDPYAKRHFGDPVIVLLKI